MREHNQDDQSGGKLSRHQVRGKSGKAQKQRVKNDVAPEASEERFSATFRFSPIRKAIFRASRGFFVDVNDVF